MNRTSTARPAGRTLGRRAGGGPRTGTSALSGLWSARTSPGGRRAVSLQATGGATRVVPPPYA